MAKIPRDAKIVSLDETETATPAAVEELDSKFIVVQLRDPIQGLDGMLEALTMRKPTGLDLIQCGNPVLFDPISDPPKVEFDMPKMVKMIARLAGISTISVQLMSSSDIVSVCWNLSPHFLPRPA
jgi:hypothetical protein